MKTLIIMRHAEAASAAHDYDRPLSDFGRRQAQAAGSWLRERVGTIDHLYVSGAPRTRQTLDSLQVGGVEVRTIDVVDDLYYGGQDDVLALLAHAPNDAEVVMVLGHEPTQSGVAHYLSDGATAAAREIGRGFPTAGIAIVDVPGGWSSLELRGHQVSAVYRGC